MNYSSGATSAIIAAIISSTVTLIIGYYTIDKQSIIGMRSEQIATLISLHSDYYLSGKRLTFQQDDMNPVHDQFVFSYINLSSHMQVIAAVNNIDKGAIDDYISAIDDLYNREVSPEHGFGLSDSVNRPIANDMLQNISDRFADLFNTLVDNVGN